ncbi:MAG TPA: hypothetical protein VIM99_03470 [Blastocatellia bacterium]
MKTVDLTAGTPAPFGSLAPARKQGALSQNADGERFLSSIADGFSGEAELLRKNHGFLALLDSRKGETATASLD